MLMGLCDWYDRHDEFINDWEALLESVDMAGFSKMTLLINKTHDIIIPDDYFMLGSFGIKEKDQNNPPLLQNIKNNNK